MSDNVINVCLCPGCVNLTQMLPVKKNIYLCRVCHQKFRQYKNGKLMYVPLGIATAMEASKIIIEFSDELIKQPSPQPEEIIFERDLDIDEDLIGMGELEFEFDPDTDFDPDESN
tara:strand:- start:135 stop:479 length:345 start_codon:yes stop_codon:yes gene_type:complete